MSPRSPVTAVMPDLVRPTRLSRHDVLSALASLAVHGIALERVVLRYAAGEADDGLVVGQHPEAGTPLHSADRVVLHVAGTGTELALPYGLRDPEDQPQHIGTRVMGEVLDSSLSRARRFVQQGGGHLFRLAMDRPDTALRWIRDILFLPTASWEADEWYRVARVLVRLPELAGRPEAIRIALGAVYGLPVTDTRLEAAPLRLDPSLGARLAIRNGRLGIDSVVGDAMVLAHRVRVTIGPVSLAVWQRQQARTHARKALYQLLVPVFLPGGVEERWVVEARPEGYRLGDPSAPALLAVSSYLRQASSFVTMQPFSRVG
jgi:hypothetical protein